MPRYRKKPVEVEAFHWTGENVAELDAFFDDGVDEEVPLDERRNVSVEIETNNGRAVAEPGYWIIREGNDFAVCPPAQFAATYEPVES